jgi:NAD(P)-dependent dehydrogenase (short-subunit alcohol dehydrogenase family)
MERLKDKVAIVTGGATGIGEAISKKFAYEGAKVVVCGFPDDPVEDVVSSIVKAGGEAIPFMGDISEGEHAKACVKFAVDHFGHLDILINNAGVFPIMEELQNYPIMEFQYLLKHNVQSTFMMTKYALPELHKTKGCIVSAGSEAGLQGLAMNSPYGGTKGFINAFMQGVAVEQAKYGVRANCVCPGPIDTSWTRKEAGPMNKTMEKQMVSSTVMGRRGTPEEVANVYLFLASDESSFVTGSLYTVGGGVTVAKGAIGDQADPVMKSQPQGDVEMEHAYDGHTRVREN